MFEKLIGDGSTGDIVLGRHGELNLCKQQVIDIDVRCCQISGDLLEIRLELFTSAAKFQAVKCLDSSALHRYDGFLSFAIQGGKRP